MACALAIVLIALDYGVAPLPLRAAQIPRFYATLAEEPGDFGILPMPVLLEAGPRGGSMGRGDQALQYYQVAHGKPIVFGHVARGTREMLDFYAGEPVVRWLLNPDGGPPQPADLDPFFFSRMEERLRLRYTVLHKPYYDSIGLGGLREYFEKVFGQELAWEDEEVLVFRMGPAVAAPGAADQFLGRFRSGVRLIHPADGAAVVDSRPLLQWEPEAAASPLFEVQVSRDQWFGRSFLYHESVDGRATEPAFSYRIPEPYPLARGAVYYWRVRGVEGGVPGPWTPTWRLRSP